jgi:ribonuclease Z
VKKETYSKCKYISTMHPSSTIKILNNRFTLTGFSRSAEATAFYVPEMDMMLDAGTVITTTKFRRLFVTHSHSDHSYQIPLMYSASSPAPIDIYIPDESLPYFDTYLTSAQLLNDHGDKEKAIATCAKRYTLHGVVDKQTIDLNNTYRVEIITCHHTVPCVGYAFYEKRNKLKSDYTNLTGKQIQELKKQGIDVTEQTFVPLFAFLGDTTPDVFAAGSNSANVLLGQMPVIICECTFLEGEQSNDKGHTHWNGLKPIIEQHPHITFVLIHFSLKHRRNEIENFFANQPLKNIIPFI